jgi:hypothetical protein
VTASRTFIDVIGTATGPGRAGIPSAIAGGVMKEKKSKSSDGSTGSIILSISIDPNNSNSACGRLLQRMEVEPPYHPSFIPC